MAKIKVYFVRHGITNRNNKGVFCGRTNVLVTEEGRQQLYKLKEEYGYPDVEHVFSSPAIRCQETASILYPNHEPELVEGFWEQNFGLMEDVSLLEWADKKNAQKWIKQDGACFFLGGESILEAQFRSMAAMTRVIQRCVEDGLKEVAIFAHGQIIGVLLRKCLVTTESPEAFLLCPNGMGYAVEVDTKEWFEKQKLLFTGFVPEGAKRPQAKDSPYFKKREKVAKKEDNEEEETISKEEEDA